MATISRIARAQRWALDGKQLGYRTTNGRVIELQIADSSGYRWQNCWTTSGRIVELAGLTSTSKVGPEITSMHTVVLRYHKQQKYQATSGGRNGSRLD